MDLFALHEIVIASATPKPIPALAASFRLANLISLHQAAAANREAR
jgi:hypothetical protein